MGPARRTCRVVAIASAKGGAGKSTSAVHLAAALALRGLAVCVLDLDVNPGSSSYLGHPGEPLGAFELLTGRAEFSEVTLRVPVGADPEGPGIDLVPANAKLEEIDTALAEANLFANPLQCLHRPLEYARQRWDVVLIDTGPNLVTPTRASYTAADAILVCSLPDQASREGVARCLRYIEKARLAANPRLWLAGILLCMVDSRTTLEREHFEGMGPEMVAAHLRARIPVAIAAQRVWKLGEVLFRNHPEHRTALAYQAAADELVLERFAWSDPAPRIALAVEA